MHYVDTTTNDNGTVTAFCNCGWSQRHDTWESADAAAEHHPYDADEYAAAA